MGIIFLMLVLANTLFAQASNNFLEVEPNVFLYALLGFLTLTILTIVIIKSFVSFKRAIIRYQETNIANFTINKFLQSLTNDELERLQNAQQKNCSGTCKNDKTCNGLKKTTITVLLVVLSTFGFAQSNAKATDGIFLQPGILITIVLILLPFLVAVIYAIAKAKQAVKLTSNRKISLKAQQLSQQINDLDASNITAIIAEKNLDLQSEVNLTFADNGAGIIQNASNKQRTNFTSTKKKSISRPALEPDITKLILWYIGCSAFWLMVGSGIGEYVGIKFVAPDADHISWLSFGRLRPVHTNIVFWGWASLGMIGLGYYVVPTVSNAKIYSIKFGWIALALTNLMVIIGSICLMAGFNNGGGEFREYVWPVMALFAVALILTLANFLLTVAKRSTKEIYISNWYIISAIIFTIIVALTAYIPFWQDGVSETIVQGYFMHSGVGMWFTLYTLGLMYYFIPQQINIPIYAYSLGILAFWTQIIFYTVIGTHHFTFAPIPWWLQTVGIVGSMGMIIPVTAATINFTMTFKGQWAKVSRSYTLPFFFVAVVYYFVVSMQGTAEAFRFTSLIWHFTDFTVAHAHLGFYGIITFVLWGGMYAIVPRLTGKEPPQYLVGAHFWLAFVGLLIYTIPLSIGSTLRGAMWMENKPFIDSVVMMFDWWLWRAIGGSIMFISHILFFYNFYKMTYKDIKEVDINQETFRILEANK